ncbi:hypothetical protein V8G54_036440, partial [Vigna mungo]
VLLGPHHLLLPPQLQHLAVRVRVFCQNKRWACRGSVLGHEPPRLVPHSTRVTQRLWAHGPGSPLWCLVRGAMQTPASVSTTAVAAVFLSWCCLRGLFCAGMSGNRSND